MNETTESIETPASPKAKLSKRPKSHRTRGMGQIYQRGLVYWVSYYSRGKRYRESSNSTNRADAVRLLKRRTTQIEQGQPVGPEVEKTDLSDLAEILINDYCANGRRSVDRIEDALNHLRRFFGLDRAINITADRVVAYITHRQSEGAAAATVNRELAALKCAFRLASKSKKVVEVPEISLLHENNARKGFFERAELERLLSELPCYLRPLIQTAYITGWRIRSELITRRVSHVDLDDGGWLRIDPGEIKNGEGRSFPLNTELRELLERQLRHVRALELSTGKIIPWLFPRDDGSQVGLFRKSWASACRRADIIGKLPHDFRRSAVRNLERSGVARSAAMAMVGHKTEAIYRRYAIVDSKMLKESAEKLDAFRKVEELAANRRVILMKEPNLGK